MKSEMVFSRLAGIPLSQRRFTALSWEKSTVIVIGLMIVIGFGLRLAGLGRIGFAEDEINKLDAVRAYDRGDFTANAEHPMLMKAMIDVSMQAARAWNSRTGQAISDEAALRFPNVLFGALTAIPLFLLTAALFDRPTAFWAAAFWSFGVNAITYNRIGKEDTLMVFFMLFAFYLYIRSKQVVSPPAKSQRCQFWFDDRCEIFSSLPGFEHALSSFLPGAKTICRRVSLADPAQLLPDYRRGTGAGESGDFAAQRLELSRRVFGRKTADT